MVNALDSQPASKIEEPAIAVDHVSHAYGHASGSPVHALVDVSLDIPRRELLCLIGPSGCGKSTLLNIIGGLVRPVSGEVRIGGSPIHGPSPDRLAFVFQDNTLFPWNTVLENIKVALEFRGIPKNERQTRSEEALEAVDLQNFMNHYPHELSGGMKQRASLARALSLKTDILLMDEPFAALDEQTRMYLGEELSHLLDSTNKTIIFVTHSLSEAVFLADRVVVTTARPGKIKAIINVDEPHPRDPTFMTSSKLSELRNELYSLLREEIQKSVRGFSDEGTEESDHRPSISRMATRAQ
jgi:NitT/TauT family transport system ATP-binding protein